MFCYYSFINEDHFFNINVDMVDTEPDTTEYIHFNFIILLLYYFYFLGMWSQF